MENYIQQQHLERRNRFFSFLLCILITSILLFIEIWYLILIPGIIVGVLNRNTRESMKIAAIGITLVWCIYILNALFTQNAYIYADQFAGLITGEFGFGWILIIFIILIGALFGALGGALGSLGAILLVPIKERELENTDNN
ncbi:MAG: hypothetical protein ACTSR8_01575 [Promethearchaeota archaeon]